MTKEDKRSISHETPLPLDFFQIQSAFAHKLEELTGISLEQALLEKTTFYVRLGIHDWKHDRTNPKWMSYWNKVEEGDDPAEAAYQIYLSEYEQYKKEPNPSCFSYSYFEPEKAIYLHFQNNYASNLSPLVLENLPIRKQELARIFAEIKDKYPEAKEVEGSSWLYTYDSYKSLFPPEFIANLYPVEPGLKGNGAWGQFLTSRGELNQKRSDLFIRNVEVAKNKEDLMKSFPIPTYDTSASIAAFFQYLGI
jgi:hypothetical protein